MKKFFNVSGIPAMGFLCLFRSKMLKLWPVLCFLSSLWIAPVIGQDKNPLSSSECGSGDVIKSCRKVKKRFLMGPSGPKGPRGKQGASGLRGPLGATGATGAAGPTGINGSIGVTGATGIAGLIGLTGDIGVTGSVGITGPSGMTGVGGITGLMGLTGSMGVTGPTGSIGLMGVTGPTGSIGPIVAGEAGATGADGSGVTAFAEFIINGGVTVGITSAGETENFPFVSTPQVEYPGIPNPFITAIAGDFALQRMPGSYYIHVNLSGNLTSIPPSSSHPQFLLYLNGNPVSPLMDLLYNQSLTPTAVGISSQSWIIPLVVGDVFSVRYTDNSAASDYTLNSAQITIIKLD